MLWGVDYYPEQWDEDRWADDARRMRAFGFKAARIMEFAWSVVEPVEGRYDFSLFKRAMDALWAEGISAVIGTPTATVPAWLYEKDPSMLQEHPGRMLRDWGARRECCFNNAAYREAAAGLVRRIGAEFGSDERVIGFQIDNEPGHEGSDRCVCPACRAEWARWLERRYGSVDRLNAAWGMVFWGRSLTRFDQAPLPRAQVSSVQNPGLILDYDRFSSDSAVAFVRSQVDILRPAAGNKWITTNLFPPPLSHAIDMEALTKGMDFASFDNYPVWGEQDEPMPYLFPSLLLSWTRGLRGGGPFCVMEQFAGQQGHACLGHLPDERRVALWTNQAVARGADKIFYFRWRTAPYGQEQLCLGLYDNDDSETARAAALKSNMNALGPLFERFASVPLKSAVAVVYDKDNARVLREQYLSLGMRVPVGGFAQIGVDAEFARQAAPYIVFNTGFDVISTSSILGAPDGPEASLEKYRLISLPLYQLADPALAKALESWVSKGGTLVLSWRTGVRDLNNQNLREAIPGPFRALAGLSVKRFESLNKASIGLRLRGVKGILPAKGQVWAEILEPETARVEARYRDRRKHYSGSPAICSNAYGAGRVWYFGTSPDPLCLFLAYRKIIAGAGIRPRFLGQGIEAVERETIDGESIMILMNHNAGRKKAMGLWLAPWETGLLQKAGPRWRLLGRA
jgi:beta-galactosidase